MKIISGKYKGKVLKGFDINGTRPTMDRVKESVFAMIQDYIRGSIVLDLYSGSGNLAIESISNNCKYAYLVDINKKAINIIIDNVNSLKIDNCKIINDSAISSLNNFINNNISFDIIFLDPPYNTDEIDKTLTIINSNICLLNDNAIIICETTINIDYTKYNNLTIYKQRKYGQKNVTILKNVN